MSIKELLLVYLLVPVLLLVFFEYIVFLIHKYVMHGFAWCWHESHHQKNHAVFEKNDLFVFVFALVAVSLFGLGCKLKSDHYLSLCINATAIGWCLYGFCYFVFHDILVHRRLKNNWVKKTKNRYLKRLVRAHAIHHKNTGKYNGESFGFLYAAKKYEFPDHLQKLNVTRRNKNTGEQKTSRHSRI